MAGDTQKGKLNKMINETTQCSDLDATDQAWILDQRNIIFQDRETSLRELLTPLSKFDLNEIVTSDALLKLSNNVKITVGKGVNFLAESYIPRFLRNYEGYIDNEKISEKTLSKLDRYDHRDFMIIGGISGAGKSVFLRSLANAIKKENPNLWVLEVDLNNYSKSFRKFKENRLNPVTLLDLLNSREESKLTNDLERKIFAIPDKVIIMLDGVNEVSSDYKDILLDIIRDCQSRNKNEYYVKHTINLLVLTGSMNLEELDFEVSHCLEPFSEKDQVCLLGKYWEQTFGLINDDEKRKCEIYAKALVKENWFKELCKCRIVGVPLLIRMIAEIFGAHENYDGGISAIYNKELTLTELYQLYILRNCCGNATGTLNSLRSDIANINLDCDGYLQILALKTILDERRWDYFSCYRSKAEKIPREKLLQFRIVYEMDNELRFTHTSIAEYFVTDCILYELRHDPTEDFLQLFFGEILVAPRFKIARTFLNSFILTDLEALPEEKLTVLGCNLKEKDYNSLLYTSAIEGLLDILKFLMKCCKAANIPIDLNVSIKGNHLIHIAAEYGHHLLVEYLIENGSSIVFRNKEDFTLLHLAAKAGSLHMVKLLVERGVEVNIKDGKGRTALHRATKKGSLEMVEYLLEHRAYVNSRTKSGYTALHIASAIGDMDKVKLLVEHGAGLDYRGRRSGMVISTAVLSGNIEVVKYLVEKGANVAVRSRSGGTMLHLLPKWSDDVSLQNIMEISKYLLEKGVDINGVNDYGETVLHKAVEKGYPLEFIRFLVEQGVNIHIISNYRNTALTNAVSKNNVAVVKLLMHEGADFNAIHSQDDVLYEAVESFHLEVLKYLRERGVGLDTKSDMGNSTLSCAVYNNKMEIVELLVKSGAKIDGEILKTALERCNLDMVKYLVENGADPQVEFEEVSNANLDVVKFLLEKGSRFKTFKDVGNDLELLQFLVDRDINVDKTGIFLHAAEDGNFGIVKYLLQKGVDVDSRTEHGSTALHWAAKRNHVSIVQQLLLHGAEVDPKDEKGHTPLYGAASHGSLEAVKILVEKGADIGNATNEEENILREAIEGDYVDVVKYLVERGALLNNDGTFLSTPLIGAFVGERFEILEFLLEQDSQFTWKFQDLVKRLLPNDGYVDEDDVLSCVLTTTRNVRYLIEKGVDIDKEEINKHGVLLNAASESDLKLVKYLIERGCDINAINCFGRTALHETVDLTVAKLLVENGANVNAKDEYGCLVICKILEESNIDVCKFLVQSGASLDDEDEDGATLLHMKIYNYGDMSPDKIKYLIESGAQLKLTKKGCSVLHDMIATSHIDLDMNKYLLKRGVDVNCRDNEGITPLDEAVIAGDLDVVRLLIASGADIDMVRDKILFRAVESYHHGNWDNSLDMVKYLVRQGANVNGKDGDGRTLLHKAIASNKFEIIKFLIDSGADVHSLDQNGISPLHEASGSGDLSVIKYFIEKGALLDVKAPRGRTVLHEAAFSGICEVVKFFVENGSDVNVTDRDGSTPLHEVSKSSIFFGHSQVVSIAKFLLERGAKLNVKTHKGYTPLHEASSNKELNLCKLFVENGADINARDEYGRTPLFSVVLASKNDYSSCDKEIIKLLVKNGVDLGHKADNQRTVLHEASIIGNLEVVELLVNLGAEVDAKTGGGRTPLHDAARRGMVKVVKFLVKKGAEVEAKTNQGTTALNEATKGEHEDVVEFFKKSGSVDDPVSKEDGN